MCECGSPMVGRQEVLQPPMGMGVFCFLYLEYYYCLEMFACFVELPCSEFKGRVRLE
jgi:hypothetical protein